MGRIKLFLICSFLPLSGFCQTLVMPHYGAGTPDSISQYNTVKLQNGEVIPWFPIETVVIIGYRPWNTEEERRSYLQLKRNVLRVLPYAIYAQKRYRKLDQDLSAVSSKKEQKKIIAACEKEIKLKITSEVKNLTVSQGKLLIKLIERQTGNTSYDLVKEMKGNVTAFVYQGVARMFGQNLKSTYDPVEEAKVEYIFREFERSRPIRN